MDPTAGYLKSWRNILYPFAKRNIIERKYLILFPFCTLKMMTAYEDIL